MAGTLSRFGQGFSSLARLIGRRVVLEPQLAQIAITSCQLSLEMAGMLSRFGQSFSSLARLIGRRVAVLEPQLAQIAITSCQLSLEMGMLSRFGQSFSSLARLIVCQPLAPSLLCDHFVLPDAALADDGKTWRIKPIRCWSSSAHRLATGGGTASPICSTPRPCP